MANVWKSWRVLSSFPFSALRCLNCGTSSSESSFYAEARVCAYAKGAFFLDKLALCLRGCPVTAGIKIALDVQGGKVSNRDGSWVLGVKSHQSLQLCLYDRVLWQDPCFHHFQAECHYMLAPLGSESYCTSQGQSCANKGCLNKYLRVCQNASGTQGDVLLYSEPAQIIALFQHSFEILRTAPTGRGNAFITQHGCC